MSRVYLGSDHRIKGRFIGSDRPCYMDPVNNRGGSTWLLFIERLGSIHQEARVYIAYLCPFICVARVYPPRARAYSLRARVYSPRG
eukprot:525739-Rhodomonas_salina.3